MPQALVRLEPLHPLQDALRRGRGTGDRFAGETLQQKQQQIFFLFEAASGSALLPKKVLKRELLCKLRWDLH